MNIQPYLTPYKWGKPVLTGSGIPGRFDYNAVDCPFVFQHNSRFYMMYVGFDGTGYQTALATSGDLLHWEHLSVILRRGEGSDWDSVNIAGTWMMKENRLTAPPVLKKWNNKYWLVYHAYPHTGYEEGSAKIGIAWTEDEDLLTWHRCSEPILAPEDGADWEKGGLYKECLVEHEGRFYLFYNAKNKNKGRWIEQTGVAFSSDLKHWERYEHNPVLPVTPEEWDSGFASDPCVLLNGDEWVMYYFGFNYKKAQEGLALSRDLLNWQKHPDPIITVGEEGGIDSIFAHKPSVITHQGVLYHFYCSCRPYREGDPTCNYGKEFRTITVATSHELPGASGKERCEDAAG
ncbi:Glycosyl hydrolases family 43 [Paenibacillus konkukensis]|uniref:Glycosyl hydrolases family 43 n=1 Tax=Paenibacillus konkukensis TaxID=2020716 RepID=A0ABY4RJ26_9BACL|nr:family 43 glycosylhydrolase [Paenibacillus konkukensis]UQZ81835.1 Glycosyl hydrolases family 43 [Paenibacillus konkukensis]